jgi:hypothetical protein
MNARELFPWLALPLFLGAACTLLHSLIRFSRPQLAAR